MSEIIDILYDVSKHSFLIILFVFVMMVVIDYFSVLTQGKLDNIVKGGLLRQYFTASLFGSLPGCLGSFVNVSFYIHGLLTFGALTGGMIATSGDEAFVMLSMFPKQAFFLFAILFVVGVLGAYITDKLIAFFSIKTCETCRLQKIHDIENTIPFSKSSMVHGNHLLIRYILISGLILGIVFIFLGIIGPSKWNWIKILLLISSFTTIFIFFTVPDHYLSEHIINHIAKKHLWRIFLWTFGALLLIHTTELFFDIKNFVSAHMGIVFIMALIIGIIPESGPNIIFVTMFAKGLIPFSVLLASSIVQDGHGLLPMLAYSFKDSLLIKVFNIIIAIAIALPLFLLGY